MDPRKKNKLPSEADKRSLTPEEQEKLDNWYAAFDVSAKDLNVFSDNEHEEKVRIRLLNKIITRIPESRHPPIFFMKPGNWMKVAVVLALFTVSFPLYNYIRKTNAPQMPDAVTWYTSEASTGKILKIRLEDGSEIWLNSGSHIKYPGHFNKKNREVSLVGEAFFNIAQDPARPFIVNTDQLKTTVLGTSFNIRAYSGLDQIMINVATGKIGITASGKTLGMLNADQQISFHKGTSAFNITTVNSALASSWQQGNIRLDGASFKELSLVVKNTWGITLETNSNRITAASFKITFNINNKPEEVMKAISKMTDANYHIHNNIITLYE